jgi:hypothetical protein
MKKTVIKNKVKPCGCGNHQVCVECFEGEQKETGIENKILERLEKEPRCIAYKTPTKGRKSGNIRLKKKRYDKTGKSDIVCCLHGYFVAIEVKKPKGKQSPEQKEFEYEIKTSMGLYWLIESVDQLEKKLFEFKLWLKER